MVAVPVESNPLAHAIVPQAVTVVHVFGPENVTPAIPAVPGGVQTFGTQPVPVKEPPLVAQTTAGVAVPLLYPGVQVTAPHSDTVVQGFVAIEYAGKVVATQTFSLHPVVVKVPPSVKHNNCAAGSPKNPAAHEVGLQPEAVVHAVPPATI